MTVRLHDATDARLQGFAAHRAGDSQLVLVEGQIPVERALRSGCVVHALAATASQLRRLEPLSDRVAEVYEVENRVLQELLGYPFHRGCIALVRRESLDTDPIAVLQALAHRPSATVVVADRLADPVNVGALVRNARALFADHVFLVDGCADPFSPRAIRASVGYVFEQPLSRIHDLDAFLTACVRVVPDFARVAAVTASDAIPLHRWARPQRLMLVLGNEGDGLSRSTLALVDQRVAISMRDDVDSLNVAAASAILLWAMRPPDESKVGP